MNSDSANYLSRPDGARIAYHKLPGKSPGVMFLGGYHSDMTGTKATALEAHCRATGRVFVRFDYTGHGVSSGTFEEGTIGSWAQDAIAVLDEVAEGPQVLVGSSMGGWIMLLTALSLPDRVSGLIGIASAPDFTEDLMWNKLSADAKQMVEKEGQWFRPSAYDEEGYPITLKLIEDGRNHLLLRAPIPITCPVRLLHGINDTDVPWEVSRRLSEILESEDVTLTLIKNGDHRLSEPADLARLMRTIDDLCDQLER